MTGTAIGGSSGEGASEENRNYYPETNDRNKNNDRVWTPMS
ncbi:hypothetical protein [Streptomyces sirii]